ncbi:hypothetical protein [Hoyosella altamirensis]|uniref:Uncharacterized protein n=1 Tax=Hoyosella altamirensis TaxID=616997 RepID=A0A839RTB0_9ACTN|nr:hypothetical protein [Hoyosella altamirensis]MBB3039587.1 hypothetical protein [Hoyosella altamirensis]
MARRRHWRTQPRDRFGRWARSGALAGAAAGAAVGGSLGSTAARKRLVAGSIRSESHIGKTRDGKWNGVKVGARYHAPGGRQVVVKGIVGVSATPTAHTTPPKAARNAAQRAQTSTGTRARSSATARHKASAGTPATRSKAQAAHRHTSRKITK